jgi:hypothetical protein
MPRKSPSVTTRLGGVRKAGSAGNCAALSSALAMMIKHKIKTVVERIETQN